MIYPLLLVIALLSDSRSDSPPELATSVERQLSYIALGDSYTIGESVIAAGTYPHLLKGQLTTDSTAVTRFEVIAKTGWLTSDLLAAMDEADHTIDTFDLVTLLIGVNNQYAGDPISLYEDEFELCLSRAIDLAGGDASKVIVLSIPDYGYTPFGLVKKTQITQEIDQYNAINRQITQSKAANYLDITDISRKGLADSGLISVDNLHPSQLMYEQWVQRLTVVVLDIINE